jgi:hypothetical protein
MNKRLVGPQRRSGQFGGQEKSVMLPLKWKGTLGHAEEMTRIFGHITRKPAQDSIVTYLF